MRAMIHSYFLFCLRQYTSVGLPRLTLLFVSRSLLLHASDVLTVPSTYQCVAEFYLHNSFPGMRLSIAVLDKKAI